MKINNVSEYEAQVVAKMHAALAGNGGSTSVASTLTDGRNTYNASKDCFLSPSTVAANLVKEMVQPLINQNEFDAIDRIQTAVNAAGIGCICQL